ncbi:MAG: FAD-dependent oxidoreductase, partial [Chthoniobacterales bacterium]
MTKRETFHVPAYDAPIIARPDVCIIGGGAAGLAAAVAAARRGLEVLMIERYGFCGGATVAGLSGTICGLHSSGDKPEQIVFGFAGEFHEAMRKVGGVHKPVPFGRTVLVPHDSFIWKEIADRFLKDAKVQVLYHSVFLDAFRSEAGDVETLIVRCLEGVVAIQPRVVVDASGDAEVVHRLHGETTFGKDGVVQTPTMIFRLGGVDMQKFLKIDPRFIDEKVIEAHKAGRYHLPRHHVYIFPMPNGNEVLCNMTRITYPDGSTPIGIKSGDMTYAEMEGRIQSRSYATFLKENISGFEKSYIVESGAQVGIRQTRSIVGKTRLTNDQVMNAAKAKGAATFSAWPIEAHGAGEVKIVYFDNQTYDIPFETLIPVESSNLLVAGRCMSAEHEALASARVTAQCLGMGYAVGAACDLMLREKIAAAN